MASPNRSVAFQMDPLAPIDIDADSTFAIALEAQARGWSLLHYEPKDLTYWDDRVLATVRPMTLRREKGNHFKLGDAETINLAQADVVWMRQDPPFDLSYITAAHILEHVMEQTLVVNDPRHVRDNPEKLMATWFRDLMPPTMITRRLEDVRAFREVHRDIIVKPLFGAGGLGVFRIKPDDENLASLVETFQNMSRDPFMIQRYLPEIRQGDKRIILIDGEPVGGLNRIPQEGEARSNLHVGGRAEATDLTAKEREICERLGPILREKGLLFVGIDVIGDYLTEINVTSPTGIQEIDRFNNTNIAGQIWDVIEPKLT